MRAIVQKHLEKPDAALYSAMTTEEQKYCDSQKSQKSKASKPKSETPKSETPKSEKPKAEDDEDS